MAQFQIGFRVRTQSSYELSMGSSRSSKFYSGQSQCLEDQDISSQFLQLCAIRHSESLPTQSFIHSRTQYIVEYDFQSQPKNKQLHPVQSKKPSSNSAPSSKYKRHYSIPVSIEKLLNSYKRCPNLSSTQILNHAYGAMFGFVIGDAVGSYLVHKTQHVNQCITSALELKGGGLFGLYPGQGTDQTELALTLAYALLDCTNNQNSQKQYNPNTVAKRYLEWMQSKPFDYPTLVAISFSQIRKQKIHNNGQFNLQTIAQDLKKGSIKNKNHESSLALIKLIPLVLWSINLSDNEFIQLIREQIKFFTPNEFVSEVCVVYGKVLREILKNNDHQLAIYQTARWVYGNGSEKLVEMWKMCELIRDVQVTGLNMNNIAVPLQLAINQVNKKELSFVDSLIKILLKGYNTDTNCAIVMGLVGAALGYNRIPNYFKNIVIDCRIQKSLRQRPQQYCSSKIVDIVPKLLENGPKSLRNSTI